MFGYLQEWIEEVNQDKIIKVNSDTKMPINTILKVEIVSDEVYVPLEKINKVVGEDMHMLSAYSIIMLQNNIKIQPDGTLTIKITLSENEKSCKKLKLFYYTDEGELQEYNYKIEGDQLVFNTTHLSNWIIFGDYQNVNTTADNTVLRVILLPILLAIATMGYVIILRRTQKGTNKLN